jgi:hypothetical protein
MNPFGDFQHLLQGHLSGGSPIPNGRVVLLELLAFISERDETLSFGLVAEAAQRYGVDVSASADSKAAFEALLAS